MPRCGQIGSFHFRGSGFSTTSLAGGRTRVMGPFEVLRYPLRVRDEIRRVQIPRRSSRFTVIRMATLGIRTRASVLGSSRRIGPRR